MGARGFSCFSRFWPWLAAVASGLLLGISYAPFSQDLMIWVALCPMIAAIWFFQPFRKFETVRIFLTGWLAGSSGFLIHLHWITEVTAAGWIALSLYCGLYTGIFALFLGIVGRPREDEKAARSVWVSSRSNLYFTFLGAAAWTGLEWMRGWFLSGFGWNGLGIALWENVPMLQISDLTGVGGLSFLICAMNIMLVLTIKRLTVEIKTGTLRPHYDFGITLALVALVFTYGMRQILAPAPVSSPLKIAAVQANIPQDQKWDPDFERKILEKYRTHSEAAISMKPDLLLWPEAATPRAAMSDRTNWAVVSGLASLWDGEFLLGTVHFDDTGDFNSILLLSDRGKEAQIYHKIHLVPFGEFIPFRKSFPVFEWMIGKLVPSDFDAGKEFVVLESRKQPIVLGPLVCFEDTLGELARQFALRGASLFVTVTNDGWFRQSAGSLQHLSQSVFRSAENKIPMVRSANTGVTCIIDRLGTVRETLTDENGKTFVEGVLFGEVMVPLNPSPTFYGRNGEVFSAACMVWVVATTGVQLIRRRRNKRTAIRGRGTV